MIYFEKMISVLPKVKAPLQFIGMLLAAGALLIANFTGSGPGYKMMCGFSIGLLLIIYAQFLPVIPQLKESHQGAVFLISLLLVILTAFFIFAALIPATEL